MFSVQRCQSFLEAEDGLFILLRTNSCLVERSVMFAVQCSQLFFKADDGFFVLLNLQLVFIKGLLVLRKLPAKKQ